MKSKLTWIGIGAAILIIIGISVLIAFTLSSNPTSTESKTTTETTQIERSLTGKTAAEDKEDVFAAATELLTLTNAPADETEYANLMKSIEAGDTTMPAELKAKIRFTDTLATEAGIDSTLYQVLVSFAALSKQSNGTDEIVSSYDNPASGVILDQEVGVAYVPTTLFANSASGTNGYSLEFVYIDGAWMLSPYMTLDELRLALVLQGQATNSSTE